MTYLHLLTLEYSPRHAVIFLDFALGIPKGNYGRITSKSGLALNYGIDVKAGVVDRGYQGNVGVILKNSPVMG